MFKAPDPQSTGRNSSMQQIWSIGIFTGDSPFGLSSSSKLRYPAISSSDVKDVEAQFVADPFMIKKDQSWFMFFEVLNCQSGLGEIGLAESKDGSDWKYKKIVIREPFHLSYPYIFEWMGEYYLIPESYQAGAIRLYKAVEFPKKWSFMGNLLTRPYLVDPSLFYFDNHWWMFVETNIDFKHDTLRLFHAEDLMGPWREHPLSPVIEGNPHIARPAGRVLVLEDERRIIRYTQDCYPTYGTQVRAFEITELSTESYSEKEISEEPVLAASGSDWNAEGMHHIDAHCLEKGKWMACVDGFLWREIDPRPGQSESLAISS
jgi:hypothetical protein